MTEAKGLARVQSEQDAIMEFVNKLDWAGLRTEIRKRQKQSKRAYLVENVAALKKYLEMSDAEKGRDLAINYPATFIKWAEENGQDDPIDEDDIEEYVVALPDDLAEKFFNEGQYLVDDAYAPSYVFMEFEKIMKDQWLIHFTHDAHLIAHEGFTKGIADLSMLGLTTAFKNESGLKQGGGYNFAYRLQDFEKFGKDRGSWKYGPECVVFRASGVLVYHHGDEEFQVIFDGKTAHDIVPITEGNDGWEITDWRGRNRPVFTAEELPRAVDWVVNNFDQYRSNIVKTPGKQIAASKTAKPAPNLQVLVSEFMKVLDPAGIMAMPTVSVVTKQNVDWGGLCSAKFPRGADGIITSVDSLIQIQSWNAGNDNTARRIIAHECCHHSCWWRNLVNVDPPIAFAWYTESKAESGHSPSWDAEAALINAVYGADFVTQTSDQSYERNELPPVYMWLAMYSDGRIGFMRSVRPSQTQTEFMQERLQRNPGIYKCVFVPDDPFLYGTPAIGDKYHVAKTPEGIALIEGFWNSGEDVSQEILQKQFGFGSFTLVMQRHGRSNQLTAWALKTMTPTMKKSIERRTTYNDIRIMKSRDQELFESLEAYTPSTAATGSTTADVPALEQLWNEAKPFDLSKTAASFGPDDVPEYFYLVFDPELGREAFARTYQTLQSRVMTGVEGISGDKAIINQFGFRGGILKMPGAATVASNKLSRLMYDNIDYLLSKDMSALYRIWDKSTSSGGRWGMMQNLAGEVIVKMRNHARNDLRYFGSDSETGRLYSKDGAVINNVKELRKYLFQSFSTQWQEHYGYMGKTEPFTETDVEVAIREALEHVARTYDDEAEWLVKDRTLHIPEGTTLIVSVDPGYNEALKRWEEYKATATPEQVQWDIEHKMPMTMDGLNAEKKYTDVEKLRELFDVTLVHGYGEALKVAGGGQNVHEFGCVMLLPADGVAGSVLAVGQKLVNDDELYSDPDNSDSGRDETPHTTSLWGIRDKHAGERVRKVMSEFMPREFRLMGVSFFDDNEEFDVVKFDCEGSDLYDFHDALKKEFPDAKETFDFHPHMTIAYVRKGLGQTIVDRCSDWGGVTVQVRAVDYSRQDGVHEYFNVEAAKVASAPYTIKIRKDPPRGWIVEAFADGNVIGSSKIRKDGFSGFGSSLEVVPEWQRRGVATAMYDAVEEQLGFQLRPRFVHSEEGSAFWKNRQKSKSAMAAPSPQMRKKKYWHGTRYESAAYKIMEDGYIKPWNVVGRSNYEGSLTPAKDRVYITDDLEMAMRYAFPMVDGGDEYGYIFEINGKDLADVIPDEDAILEIMEDIHHERNMTGIQNRPALKKRIVKFLTDNYDEDSLQNGDYTHIDEAKVIATHLPFDLVLDILKMPAVGIAHEGKIPFQQCWRFLGEDVADTNVSANSNISDWAEPIGVATV